MAHWRRKLHIKEEWRQAKSGEITPAQLAQAIAAKLKELPEYPDDLELDSIVYDFEELPGDAPDAEFNDIFERLYNWGDQTLDSSGPFSTWTKQCWIATF